MKPESLHHILQQACPQIHYLETESPEAFEGECSLWEREDCTVIIDLPQPFSGSLNAVAALIRQRFDWLAANRGHILNAVFADADIADSLKDTPQNREMLTPLYLAFFIESEEEIACDFALCTENGGRCIELSLEADLSLNVNGWGEPL